LKIWERIIYVALWHVLMGHAVGALDRPDMLEIKPGKFATEMGSAALRAFGFNTKADFVAKKLYLLRSHP
jgi:hypothetical protein